MWLVGVGGSWGWIVSTEWATRIHISQGPRQGSDRFFPINQLDESLEHLYDIQGGSPHFPDEKTEAHRREMTCSESPGYLHVYIPNQNMSVYMLCVCS